MVFAPSFHLSMHCNGSKTCAYAYADPLARSYNSSGQSGPLLSRYVQLLLPFTFRWKENLGKSHKLAIRIPNLGGSFFPVSRSAR